MTAAESWRRQDRHSVTPRIVTADPRGLADFIRAAFGAEGEFEEQQPTELRLGDSLVMVDDGGGVRDLTAAFLMLYVPDADVVYQRVIALGATSLEEPTDKPWGDRVGTVQDKWGNTWQIATVIG